MLRRGIALLRGLAPPAARNVLIAVDAATNVGTTSVTVTLDTIAPTITVANPQDGSHADFVEQRANAFAIAFLAPIDSVRAMTPQPIDPEAVAKVMQTFGISRTASRYHVSNAHYREAALSGHSYDVSPSEDWLVAEDFTLDWFPIVSTPPTCRGQFAGMVAECYRRNMLSSQTAALYLHCSEEEFVESADAIRELHPL